MKLNRIASLLGFAALVVLVAAFFWIRANVKFLEVDCAVPEKRDQITCAAPVCDQELRAKAILPSGARSVQWRHLSFSDKPNYSEHIARYRIGDEVALAKCEMKGQAVSWSGTVYGKEALEFK